MAEIFQFFFKFSKFSPKTGHNRAYNPRMDSYDCGKLFGAWGRSFDLWYPPLNDPYSDFHIKFFKNDIIIFSHFRAILYENRYTDRVEGVPQIKTSSPSPKQLFTTIRAHAGGCRPGCPVLGENFEIVDYFLKIVSHFWAIL